MTAYTHNAKACNVSITNKAKQMGITGFYISARRWFQASYGNTYHSAKVYAVMADGSMGDVVASNAFSYGYGESYYMTACQALIDAGMIEADNEYALSGHSVRSALNIEASVADVKRKRDL